MGRKSNLEKKWSSLPIGSKVRELLFEQDTERPIELKLEYLGINNFGHVIKVTYLQKRFNGKPFSEVELSDIKVIQKNKANISITAGHLCEQGLYVLAVYPDVSVKLKIYKINNGKLVFNSNTITLCSQPTKSEK